MATAIKLPSGSWRVRLYVGKNADGKNIYKSFTASTKKQAEFMAAMDQVQTKKKQREGLSVGECIDRYIDAKEAVLSPKTIKEYRAVRKRTFPDLMPLPASSLNNEILQLSVSKMAASLSPKTVKNAYALLVSSLRLFMPEYRPNVTLPQSRREEISIPGDNAVKQLLSASTGVLKTAIMFSAVLGLRRSEICALEWKDIDLKKHTLRVCKALVLGPDQAWITKTTKTASSTRTLDMPSVLVDYLSSLPHEEDRLVPVTPDGITFRFISLRDKLNLSLRFHDLRHYYASTLLEIGVPDLYAMKRMGHATTNMLKAVYQHIKDERDLQVDQAIEKKLNDVFL